MACAIKLQLFASLLIMLWLFMKRLAHSTCLLQHLLLNLIAHSKSKLHLAIFSALPSLSNVLYSMVTDQVSGLQSTSFQLCLLTIKPVTKMWSRHASASGCNLHFLPACMTVPLQLNFLSDAAPLVSMSNSPISTIALTTDKSSSLSPKPNSLPQTNPLHQVPS